MAIEYLDDDQPQSSAPQSSKIEYLDPPAGDYWGDVGKNAVAGIKQWPQAAEMMGGQALKMGQAMMPGELLRNSAEVLGGTPAMQTPAGQGAKALYDVGKGAVGGIWQGIKDTGSLVKAPLEMMGGVPMAQTEIGEKFRERPLSVPAGVAGTVLPAVSALKGLGGVGAGEAAATGIAGETIPQDLLPALKYKGKTFVGNPGDLHADIVMQQLRNEPNLDWDSIDNGYVDKKNNQFLNYREAGKAIGMKGDTYLEAGGLKNLQGLTPESTTSAGTAPPPEPPPPGAGAPPPSGGATPPPKPNPMQEVQDFLAQKYKPLADQPGRIEGMGRYLQNFSQEMGGKDIGIQPRQIQSMGPGLEGLKKAEALIDYARDKGYFNPTLTDIARKAKIQQVLDTTGQRIDAIRSIADKRGAPPVGQILNEVKAQLTDQYGIDAPKEINKVLLKIQKAPPTFSGMADLATELNKAKTTAVKLGQHPGPTTDAANIVSRINNESMRQPSILNPQEAQTYTKDLQDFGAHKKLEQTVAAAGRRGLAARSNQRGIMGRLYQEALDRGGYRIAGNVAHRLGRSMVENPANFNTMPQFFEQLAHEAGDVLDETMEPPQMAHGGIVGEMDAYLTPRYGGVQ